MCPYNNIVLNPFYLNWYFLHHYYCEKTLIKESFKKVYQSINAMLRCSRPRVKILSIYKNKWKMQFGER
ncbi:DNA-directed RNA polymerase subunit beta, putative [Medicago truncatula]|uniref:DNA-directed RNA polymerase subunit beta, putative n=1 Tax=Medicago truncatula TaxID=3880 RepID=G7J446_MEDTR|nr:DNA-directed RNA polymerase subunit beta, putative [Medicago truncatula]